MRTLDLVAWRSYELGNLRARRDLRHPNRRRRTRPMPRARLPTVGPHQRRAVPEVPQRGSRKGEPRMSTYVEERTYYPTGADPDDFQVRGFQVGAFYRGRGKWMVSPGREGHMQLSRTGKWLWLPLKMTAMRWCRFDFETACALAEEHVDSFTVNGRTWAQWQEGRSA